MPGAAGQPHDRLPEASHFLQDDQGTEIATRLVDWYGSMEDEGAGGPSGSTPWFVSSLPRGAVVRNA